MTCTFISTGSGVNREVWAGLDYEGRPTLTNFVESEQAFRGIQYYTFAKWSGLVHPTISVTRTLV